MKKCPNCQKTFEDNLKFCQSDGSPLVVVAEEEPSNDPYKTMVASDLKLSDEETKVTAEESSPEPETSDPPAVAVADVSSDVNDFSDDNEDVLQIPDQSEPVEPAAEIPVADEPAVPMNEISEEPVPEDPMKTMMVSGGDTSDNIKVKDLDDAEPAQEIEVEDDPPAADEVVFKEEYLASEADTMIAPNIPKFSEPEIEPPDLSASDFDSGSGKDDASASKGVESKTSVPIPSPFDESMPPGVTPPDNPPFEKDEANIEAGSSGSQPAPPASPFTDQAKQSSGTEDWDIAPMASGAGAADQFGSNEIVASGEGTEESAEGENRTLAIVSLVSGILGVLCCAAGILFGPIALITGFMAKGKIEGDPSVYGGSTFAKIGMILGAVGIVLSIIVIALNIFSIASSF